MNRILGDIIDFSEMARFIDVPVKHYSSGMFMRLGFSIAIHVEPDILLVDEVLAVGDQSFQSRCLDKIHGLKRRGVAIVLVTHDLESVRRMCDRVIWLHKGRVEAEGPPVHILEKYLDQVRYRDEQALLGPQHIGMNGEEALYGGGLDKALGATDDRASGVPSGDIGPDGEPGSDVESMGVTASADAVDPANRWGSREAEILAVQLLDQEGHERRAFQPGQAFVARIHFCAPERIENPQFGLALFHSSGFHINGPNTVFSGLKIDAIEGEGYIDYLVESLPLLEGTYLVSAALYDYEGSHAYDYHHQLYAFRVHPNEAIREKYGSILIPSSWRVGPTGFACTSSDPESVS
jgi:lipopolysaccharide transport system ATP-binding protein